MMNMNKEIKKIFFCLKIKDIYNLFYNLYKNFSESKKGKGGFIISYSKN